MIFTMNAIGFFVDGVSVDKATFHAALKAVV